MRNRIIKPDKLFKNFFLADRGPHSQLLLAGMWCMADREGRLEDQPVAIKAEIFPYYEVEVDRLLNDLEIMGFVERYKVGSMALIQLVDFEKYQSPHHSEKKSALPPAERRATATRRAPAKAKTEAKPVIPTADTWKAYQEAFAVRYGVSPVRNAMVNGQINSFVKRVGESEAPAIAAFYVRHNNAYYVRSGHSVGAMLRDAEKLRTEWATGKTMTDARAHQIDKTQTNIEAFSSLLDEAIKKEREHGKRGPH